jgi:periplasmic divalent cation tolerance protein
MVTSFSAGDGSAALPHCSRREMADEIVLAFSTFPDLETGRRIARQLVDENLAACANLIPKIESFYRWQGEIEQAEETLVLFKTTNSGFPVFRDRLKSLHPYDVPEIICTPVANGWPDYLAWVRQNVS